jgi:hypothetical protein
MKTLKFVKLFENFIILKFLENLEVLNFKTIFIFILEFWKSVNLGRSGC